MRKDFLAKAWCFINLYETDKQNFDRTVRQKKEIDKCFNMVSVDEGPLPSGLQEFYGVKIGPSKIPGAGLGLFATKKFKRNDPIVPYLGTRLPEDVYADNRHCTCYAWIGEDDQYIDARSSLAGLGRYVNTCHRPEWLDEPQEGEQSEQREQREQNVLAKSPQLSSKCVENARVEPWKQWALVVATRTILPGEEILWDYGPEYGQRDCTTGRPVRPDMWESEEQFGTQYSEWLGRYEEDVNKCRADEWKKLRDVAEKTDPKGAMPRGAALFLPVTKEQRRWLQEKRASTRVRKRRYQGKDDSELAPRIAKSLRTEATPPTSLLL